MTGHPAERRNADRPRRDVETHSHPPAPPVAALRNHANAARSKAPPKPPTSSRSPTSASRSRSGKRPPTAAAGKPRSPKGFAVGGNPTPFVTSLEPATGSTNGRHLGDHHAAGTSPKPARCPSARSKPPPTKSCRRARSRPSPRHTRAGTVTVTVTTPKGTSGAGAALAVHLRRAAVAHRRSNPTKGPNRGARSSRSPGTQLELASEVKFGAVPAKASGCSRPTRSSPLPRRVPARSRSRSRRRSAITAPGSASQFTYVKTGLPPEVKKLSVKKGPASGGTQLTITGDLLHLRDRSELRPGAGGQLQDHLPDAKSPLSRRPTRRA